MPAMPSASVVGILYVVFAKLTRKEKSKGKKEEKRDEIQEDRGRKRKKNDYAKEEGALKCDRAPPLQPLVATQQAASLELRTSTS